MVDAIFTFHVYLLSCTCIRVRILFRYKRCDICVDLHMIYNYLLAVLDTMIEFAGGFIMFLYIKGKDKRNEGD